MEDPVVSGRLVVDGVFSTVEVELTYSAVELSVMEEVDPGAAKEFFSNDSYSNFLNFDFC